jgi:hypothetical protein
MAGDPPWIAYQKTHGGVRAAPPTAAAPSPEEAPADKPKPWETVQKARKEAGVEPHLEGHAPDVNIGEGERGYVAEAADAFVGEMKGSWEQLKADWVRSQGGTIEEQKKMMDAPIWTQLKGQFDRTMATGKLPLDAFSVVLSPLTGAMRAGIAKPMAKGVHALLPGSEEMEKEGKLPAIEDKFMEALSMAGPAKGRLGGIRGAMRLSKGKTQIIGTGAHLADRGSLDPKEFARRYVARGLKKEGISKEEAIKQVSKPGQTISDIGKTRMIEAGEQAALKGEGRRLGSDLFHEQRMKGREERMTRTVDNLVSDKSFYEELDTLFQDRMTESKPLYTEAFEGGSHAALQGQFENEFNTASKAARDARQLVDDAENRLTQAHARHPGEGDNVYASASRNRAVSEAEAGVKDAQAQLDAALEDRQGALDRLQTAQEHERLGIKGGLWSPALADFLGHPIVKQGIQAGIEIEELNVLGTGRPPQLSEYALTKGPGGELVPSKVPNLRLLDTAKQGLDAILSKYPRDIRGKPILDKYGQAVEGVRKRFVAELDRLTETSNPAYKKARDTWAGPSRVIEKMHQGRDFMNMDHEEISALLKDATADQHEGFKIGVARAIVDQMTHSPTGTVSVSKKIADTTAMQKKLRAALKDDDAVQEIIDMAEREIEWHRRGGAILGGSKTARVLEAGKEFDEIAPVIDELVAGAQNGLTGVTASAKTQVGRVVGQWMKDRIAGLSDARREALARLIFSTNREDNIQALELLYDESTVTVPQVGKRRLTAPLAAAGSTPQGPTTPAPPQSDRDAEIDRVMKEATGQ